MIEPPWRQGGSIDFSQILSVVSFLFEFKTDSKQAKQTVGEPVHSPSQRSLMKDRRISVRLSGRVVARLQKAALRRKVPLSEVVRELVEKPG